MRCITGYISLLSVLLALLFFASSISAFSSYSEQQTPVQCCDKDEDPQFPVKDGDCLDCQCLTCSAVLNNLPEENLPFLPVARNTNWPLMEGHPSDYIKLIDYPPELT
jgi:hypothetical protein